MDRPRKYYFEWGDQDPHPESQKPHVLFNCGPGSNSSDLSIQHGETTETRIIKGP